MLMQNFGVTNKEHYGMLRYFWSGQLNIVRKCNDVVFSIDLDNGLLVCAV